MEFTHPKYFFLLLLLIPLIAWYVIKLSRMQASFRLASNHAFRKMPRSLKVYLRHLPFVLRIATLSLLIVVLARPHSVNKWQTTESKGIDIVLAVDISGSML
ncbi:MAG: BatA domain-containing protein, partial [Dysgonamonadaceae bacterium]|nr:BatA domain-containing protein [Dysgonamonadaceae bacterium]